MKFGNPGLIGLTKMTYIKKLRVHRRHRSVILKFLFCAYVTDETEGMDHNGKNSGREPGRKYYEPGPGRGRYKQKRTF